MEFLKILHQFIVLGDCEKNKRCVQLDAASVTRLLGEIEADFQVVTIKPGVGTTAALAGVNSATVSIALRTNARRRLECSDTEPLPHNFN